MNNNIKEELKMVGIWNFKIKNQDTGEERVFVYKNLIPTVSRQQIAKALSGNIAGVTEIKITHQEMGTSTQAPANGDTGLITPTASTRKTISSLAYSSNQLSVTAFWAAGEATGTWREFGCFVNGTATSNSGVLFNRVSINITVASNESLTVDGTVTFN
jgi:urate oxidase